MEKMGLDEFENGARIFSVTKKEMAETPVSDLLCGNFLEVGFGYQVENMWSEMLHNRSFEKAVPHVPTNYRWFGLDYQAGDLWQEQEWYHSGYELNRWYAAPAQDAPMAIRPDSSFIVEMAPFYSLSVTQKEGGIHGTHCLNIRNFELGRWCGVAQNGMYMKYGKYIFRGWFKQLSETVAVEVRFYKGHEEIDWEEPVLTFPVHGISKEGSVIEIPFEYTDETDWYAFSVFVAPGSEIETDAFSLKPVDTALGWRPDVVEELKKLNPKIIRFPGGCFASYHDWTDAVGSMDSRRPEPSYSWGDVNYNDVGTDEFLQLCEMLGCEAMLVPNLFHPNKRLYRKAAVNGAEIEPHGFILDNITDPELGVKRAAQWVEYCNGSTDTEYGSLRAKNGHPAPYGVKYWEMDNEAFRWMTWEEYAHTVKKYSRAMKAVDSSIMIGLTSYHAFRDNVEDMLEICGNEVDFLADRMCEPDNIARKIGIVEKYNENHEHKLFYSDTEALQARDMMPAPFVGEYFKNNKITFQKQRRTWLYALNLVSNLMIYHRYGSIAKFMCFNNLCNTTGQSCIEVSKEKVILPFCGKIYERMSRSEACWPLEIEGYEPSARKNVQIQAAWNKERTKLICYLLNRTDTDSAVTLDLGLLGQGSFKSVAHTMSAQSGMIQETIKKQGNLKEYGDYFTIDSSFPKTFEIPAFSFTEVVIG